MESEENLDSKYWRKFNNEDSYQLQSNEANHFKGWNDTQIVAHSSSQQHSATWCSDRKRCENLLWEAGLSAQRGIEQRARYTCVLSCPALTRCSLRTRRRVCFNLLSDRWQSAL